MRVTPLLAAGMVFAGAAFASTMGLDAPEAEASTGLQPPEGSAASDPLPADDILRWMRSLPRDLQGRPEGAWPRATPFMAFPAVRGATSILSGLTFNLGQATFEGEQVFEVPEIGVRRTWTTGQLAPFDRMSRPPIWPDGSDPWDPAEPNMLLRTLFLEVPASAPDRLTLRIWAEKDGALVGGVTTQTIAVADAWCGTHASFYGSAGQKDVWFPWDTPWIAFTLCNPTEETRTATLLAHDRTTLRPLVDPGGNAAGLSMWLAQGSLEGALIAPNAARVPPGQAWAFLAAPEAIFVPTGIEPVYTIAWDDGRIEQVDGDPVTFAGTSEPRVDPPPLPDL